PRLRPLELLDMPPLRANDEILDRHAGDLIPQLIADTFVERRLLAFEAFAEIANLVATLGRGLKQPDQLHSRPKQPLAERHRGSPLRLLDLGVEEVEVAEIVEDVEILLVALLAFAGAENARAEPRATADHLPEFRLRPDDLEEDQVQDLRDV